MELRFLEGGDSFRWYAWIDPEPDTEEGKSLEKRIELIFKKHRNVAYELRDKAEVRPCPRGIYAVKGEMYVLPLGEALRVLQPYLDELEEEARRKKQAEEEFKGKVRALKARGGALVALKECWECGWTAIIGEITEDMRVVRMSPELFRRASQAYRNGSEEFEFRVVRRYYCGC